MNDHGEHDQSATTGDGPGRRLRPATIIAVIAPGLLVAATGVGAGDLSTAGFAGAQLGLAVLWAVALGALLKFLLTEGIARHQLATGDTLLEGACRRLGLPVIVIFLLYLLPWTVLTGGALISACGATAHAMLPVFEDAERDKQLYGVAISLIGLAVVWIGGFRIFERVMGVCIAVMFLSVMAVAAWLVYEDQLVDRVIRGLVVPSVPHDPETPGSMAEPLAWTLALLGGVGGTVTVLCYGYWMQEVGRDGPRQMRTCRIDLVVGYTATALFGMSMLIIASDIVVEGRGVKLIANLGEYLADRFGPWLRWVFLTGAACAVFSSLLGVWQAVPYLFADLVGIMARRRRTIPNGSDDAAPPASIPLERTIAYRAYLLGLATVPIASLWLDFRSVQKWYAILGATFLPMLALVLLILNRRAVVGDQLRNRWFTVAGLVLTLVLFLWYGWSDLSSRF